MCFLVQPLTYNIIYQELFPYLRQKKSHFDDMLYYVLHPRFYNTKFSPIFLCVMFSINYD